MDVSENVVQSVDRALLILETLAQYKNGCGVTAISKEVGLHKSTVHRLLGTLMYKGYVQKDIDSDNYRLGNKVLYLASSILDNMDVRNIARPYIIKLSERTNEVVHLSILDGDEVVYIDKVESQNTSGSFRMNSQIGKRVPLYCTAAGKVLASQLKDVEIKALLSGKDMQKFTANTITTIEQYLDKIQDVKNKGYALDDIEHEEGIRCIAVPIYDRNGKIIAAVSISGLTIYITQERIPELKQELLKTAMDISIQLGYMHNIKI